MSHEPQLIPDATLFIQLAIFLATYFVLNSLVFKPFLALMELRKARTSGLKEKAAAEQERADKLRADYDLFMKAERKTLAGFVENEKKKIAEEERVILQKAREVIAGEMHTLRQKTQGEYESARKDLNPLIAEYSLQIASKLLGRNVERGLTAHELSAHTASETTVPG